MTTEQQQVAEWMVKFGQEVLSKPTIPSLEVRKLRAKLILEEALETIRGLNLHPYVRYNHYEDDMIEDDSLGFWENPKDKPSLEEITDGIADSMFVLLGTAAACGIDMEYIFKEVVRSNSSKLWSNEEYENYLGSEQLNFKPMGGKYLAKNLEGKVIKSPSYSPPNIKQLLENQNL